jgi:hypothetical protein
MTQCYAMVRGSAIRVTGLDRRGSVPSPVSLAVSRSVTRVTIDEVAEAASNEMLRNEKDERRLLLVRPSQTIRYKASIDFLRTDPGILSLVSGLPVVTNANGDVVGFDAQSKIPATAFALEVWTRLASSGCSDAGAGAGFGEGDFGDGPFGGAGAVRQWGYTLFPFLKGGMLSGFTFANGLVSFTLTGAQTRRASRWGFGPYDLDGPFQRLVEPVSGNTNWRQTLVTGAPPEQTDGVIEYEDVVEGGTATMTSEDVLDGEFVVTSSAVVDGGGA